MSLLSYHRWAEGHGNPKIQQAYYLLQKRNKKKMDLRIYPWWEFCKHIPITASQVLIHQVDDKQYRLVTYEPHQLILQEFIDYLKENNIEQWYAWPHKMSVLFRLKVFLKNLVSW